MNSTIKINFPDFLPLLCCFFAFIFIIRCFLFKSIDYPSTPHILFYSFSLVLTSLVVFCTFFLYNSFESFIPTHRIRSVRVYLCFCYSVAVAHNQGVSRLNGYTRHLNRIKVQLAHNTKFTDLVNSLQLSSWHMHRWWPSHILFLEENERIFTPFPCRVIDWRAWAPERTSHSVRFFGY